MNLAPAGNVVTAAVDARARADFAWIVIGVVTLLLLCVSCVRVVPEHERTVVSRLGRASRVVGPGVIFRVPGLDRLTTVSLRPMTLYLAVSAITRDGVPVHVMATGVYRITDPLQSTSASPDAFRATTAKLEGRLAREIAHRDLPALLPAREELEARLPREVTKVTAGWGVEVTAFELSEIETRLTADLLRSVRRQPAGDA